MTRVEDHSPRLLGQDLSENRLESGEIRPLTGIRGFAALMVVLFHFQASWVLLLPGLSVLTPLARRGYLGVDLFFILSGFILCYVHKPGTGRFDAREYLKFLGLRLARVYPNHLATLGFLIGMVALARFVNVPIHGSEYDFRDLPLQLTMTHAWPGLEDRSAFYWNYPSWSISCEWFAYLFVFPACWFGLKHNWGPAVFLTLGYAFLLVWLCVAPRLGNDLVSCILRVACEFAAGATIFRAWWTGPLIGRYCQQAVTWTLLATLVALEAVPLEFSYASQTVILIFPLVLLGLTTETTLVGRVFSSPVCLWLGNVSYALYMSHALVQKAMKIALPAERFVHVSLGVRLGVVMIQLLALLGGASALYYFVELPSRNCLRKRIRRLAN